MKIIEGYGYLIVVDKLHLDSIYNKVIYDIIQYSTRYMDINKALNHAYINYYKSIGCTY